MTVAKTRKAAEDRFRMETDSRRWEVHLGDDPLSEALVTKVLKKDFFQFLRPYSQKIYNRGLGVIWPLNGQLLDLGPKARREYEDMMRRAKETQAKRQGQQSL